MRVYQPNVDMGLVPLMANDGWAQAGKSIGQGLIDLGKKKNARAKEAEIKAEKDRRETMAFNVQADKNRILNPKATNQLLDLHGIKKDSPLASPDAPTRANQSLGMMDLGKQADPKFAFNYKNADGRKVGVRPDGEEVILGKTFDPIKYGTYVDENFGEWIYDKANPKDRKKIGQTVNQYKESAKHREKSSNQISSKDLIPASDVDSKALEKEGIFSVNVGGKPYFIKSQIKAHRDKLKYQLKPDLTDMMVETE